jgi:hypothetical protein
LKTQDLFRRTRPVSTDKTCFDGKTYFDMPVGAMLGVLLLPPWVVPGCVMRLACLILLCFLWRACFMAAGRPAFMLSSRLSMLTRGALFRGVETSPPAPCAKDGVTLPANVKVPAMSAAVSSNFFMVVSLSA